MGHTGQPPLWVPRRWTGAGAVCLGTGGVPTSALRRGTKTPKCWGVLVCGATSVRPLWGYSKRATLGGCSAGTVPRSARRLGASLLGCLWRVVHWVRGLMAHCRFPGSGSISPPCVVNERAMQVLSTPRRDSGWKRTCNMCGCRCPVPCRCAIALQGTAPR